MDLSEFTVGCASRKHRKAGSQSKKARRKPPRSAKSPLHSSGKMITKKAVDDIMTKKRPPHAEQARLLR